MSTLTIGVLALQGAFAEHATTINQLGSNPSTKPALFKTLSSRLVKTTADLAEVDALIIPGGESTTIARVAERSGLLESLREFVKTKPVWGTCAGAILLAETIEGAKKGGQELLGGMTTRIGRNGYGSQVYSFEAPLIFPKGTFLAERDEEFVGVFIRAPVVLSIREDPSRHVQILARVAASSLPPHEDGTPASDDDPRTIVALRQGLVMMTTYHPELTRDDRFHEYFVAEVVAPFVKGQGSTV